MRLPKWLITVTPFSKILALILFVALPILAFIFGEQYGQLLTVKNQASQQMLTTIPNPTLKTIFSVLPTTPLTTPFPSIPVGGTIVAINVKNPNYSFKFPIPYYCSGCADGLSGPYPGYKSETIENQASLYKMPASENWVIQYITSQNIPGAERPNNDWSIPILTSDFTTSLAKLNINDSLQLTSDQDHKSYSFIRLEDKIIDGITAHIYQNNNTIDNTHTKYAVFTKGDYTYILSFEWSNDTNKYIFDLITSSFQFSLRPDSEVIHF